MLQNKGDLVKKKKTSDIGGLKLFVWVKFYPDCTSMVLFAIAETENEAKELVIKKRGYGCDDWGTLEVKPISKCAYSVPGGS